MCLAVPGKVEEIFSQDLLKMAKVDFGGIKRTVCLQCIDDVQPGDYVLVHVGVALAVIDEVVARETLDLLNRLGERWEAEI